MNATIVISSFREPNLKKALDAALNQETNEKYDVLVISPDKEAEELVNELKNKKKRISFLKDPGKGKSFGLNLAFKKLKSDIWIFTDADVYFGKDVVQSICNVFKDETVGCVCGKIIPTNSKSTITGYWAHLLAEAGANSIRKELSDKNLFLECSGYLFAFRKNLISQIPLNVAEDSYIPFLIFKKGYKIKYSENSVVYVKNPTKIKDFIKQRIRTAKSHSSLTDYFADFPKVKSFKNEVKKGTFRALSYPSNLKEFFWTILLFFTRLYIWTRVFCDEKIVKKNYQDNWERIESSK
jgi:cellulose synthase/poly-beta-1,6-N-acetylglucosamine synthase-like glycosyltransferase